MLPILYFHCSSSIPLPGAWILAVHINAIRVRALTIGEIGGVKIVIILFNRDWGDRQRRVANRGGRQGGVAVDGSAAPDFGRNLEGGLIVGTLKGVVFAGAEFVNDITVLLLKTAELLDKLVLVEIELEFALDLIIKRRRVVVVLSGAVGPAALRRVVEEPLQQLDFVLVGPEALEELAGLVGLRRFLGDDELRLILLLFLLPEVGIGDAGQGDGHQGGGIGRRRAIDGGDGDRRRGIVFVVVEALFVIVVVEEVLVFVEDVSGDGGVGGVIGGGHGIDWFGN